MQKIVMHKYTLMWGWARGTKMPMVPPIKITAAVGYIIFQNIGMNILALFIAAGVKHLIEPKHKTRRKLDP